MAGGPHTEPIITVEGLEAAYGDRLILKDVSFQVFRGEVFIILGPSGCGKSTLLKHMIGLYRPVRGRITVNGVDLTTAGDDELHDLRRRIGVLFQSGALFGSMTLAENVDLALREFTDLPPEFIDRVVAVKLRMVDLEGQENRLPAELSGGMKIRAGLARALALDPEVLFLDEPSAGLDPITSAEIDILIRRINSGMGTTMIIISQDLPSVFELADRVIILDTETRGVIAEGDPRELKAGAKDPRVKAFFNRHPLARS